MATLFNASTVNACPFCHTPSGVNEVKAGIFNETFWVRTAAVLAPFPIFAGIIAFIYFGPAGKSLDKEEITQ